MPRLSEDLPSATDVAGLGSCGWGEGMSDWAHRHAVLLRKCAITYVPRLEGHSERAWVCGELARIASHIADDCAESGLLPATRWRAIVDDLESDSAGAEPPRAPASCPARWIPNRLDNCRPVFRTTWARDVTGKWIEKKGWGARAWSGQLDAAFASLLRALCPPAAESWSPSLALASRQGALL